VAERAGSVSEACHTVTCQRGLRAGVSGAGTVDRQAMIQEQGAGLYMGWSVLPPSFLSYESAHRRAGRTFSTGSACTTCPRVSAQRGTTRQESVGFPDPPLRPALDPAGALSDSCPRLRETDRYEQGPGASLATSADRHMAALTGAGVAAQPQGPAPASKGRTWDWETLRALPLDSPLASPGLPCSAGRRGARRGASQCLRETLDASRAGDWSFSPKMTVV
jgi:hypothetical protein